MIEIKLVNVNFSVTPLEGEQKQINFLHQPTQTVYLAPFGEDAIKVLLEELQMSNEDLQKKIEQKRLAAELAVTPEEMAAVDSASVEIPRGPSS